MHPKLFAVAGLAKNLQEWLDCNEKWRGGSEKVPPSIIGILQNHWGRIVLKGVREWASECCLVTDHDSLASAIEQTRSTFQAFQTDNLRSGLESFLENPAAPPAPGEIVRVQESLLRGVSTAGLAMALRSTSGELLSEWLGRTLDPLERFKSLPEFSLADATISVASQVDHWLTLVSRGEENSKNPFANEIARAAAEAKLLIGRLLNDDASRLSATVPVLFDVPRHSTNRKPTDSIGMLSIEAVAGSGRLIVDPESLHAFDQVWIEGFTSIWQSITSNSLPQMKFFREHDVFWKLSPHRFFKSVSGGSAQAAFCCALHCLAMHTPWPKNLIATGEVAHIVLEDGWFDGRLTPVDGVSTSDGKIGNKLRDVGNATVQYRTVAIPRENENALTATAKDNWSGTTGKALIGVNTLKELFDFAGQATRKEASQLTVLVSMPETLRGQHQDRTIRRLLEEQKQRYTNLASIQVTVSSDSCGHPRPGEFDVVIGVVNDTLGSQNPVPPSFYEHPANHQPTVLDGQRYDSAIDQPVPERSSVELDLLSALRWMPGSLRTPLLFAHHQPEFEFSSLSPSARQYITNQLNAISAFENELQQLGRERISRCSIAGDQFHFRAEFKGHLESLIQTSLREKGFSEQSIRNACPAATWNGNPFRALERFEFEHAEVFRGRQTQVDELRRRFKHRAKELATGKSGAATMVLVYGASGCGKSSLMRAGLIPSLVNDRFQTDEQDRPLQFRAAIAALDRVTHNQQEFDGDFECALGFAREISRSLQQDIFTTSEQRVVTARALPSLVNDVSTSEHERIESFARLIVESPGEAAARINEHLIEIETSGEFSRTGQQVCQLILGVDQLDQLLVSSNRKSSSRIVDFLVGLAQGGHVWVIATLQSTSLDFLGETSLRPLACGDALFRLESPEVSDWIEIVRGAAEAAGLSFEKRQSDGRSLADHIVHDAHNSPDCLPLLEFALDRLYKKDCCESHVDVKSGQEKFAGCLKFSSYDGIGGVAGALLHEAASLDEKLSQNAKKEIGKLFWHLVQVDPRDRVTRLRPAPRNVVESIPELDSFVVELIRARLLTVNSEPQREVSQIRLTHNRLIASWPLLAEWEAGARHLILQRERFEEDAVNWNSSGRENKLLLRRDGDINYGRAILDSGYDTDSLVEAYISASEQQIKNRKRGFIVILGVALLLATGFVVAFRDYLVGRTMEALAAHEMSLAYANGAAEDRPVEAKLLYRKASALAARAKVSPFRAHLGLSAILQRSPEPVKWVTVHNEGTVLALAMSPDGTRILTGGGEPAAFITDWHSGQRLHKLNVTSPGIDAVCFSPDGKLAVTGGRDQTVRVWNAETGELIGERRFHTADITKVCVLDDSATLVSGDESGTVIVTNVQSGEIATSRQIANGPVSDLQPFGKSEIAICTSTADIHVCDAKSLTASRSFSASNTQGFSKAVWTQDGKRLVGATVDTFEIVVWDAGTGDVLRVFQSGHREVISSLTSGPEPDEILTSSWDGSLRVLNVDTSRTRLLYMLPDKKHIEQAVMSPDKQWMVACELSPDVPVYRVPPPNGWKRLSGHVTNVRDADFSPDDQLVISAGNDGSVRLFDVAARKQLCIVGTHDNWVTSVRFVPNSDPLLAISTDTDGMALIWDVLAKKQIGVFDDHVAEITTLDVSVDGTRAASASEDGQVVLWYVSTREPYAILTGHDGNVAAVTFSPDGRLLATAGFDRKIRIWNATTGDLIHEMGTHFAPIEAVKFFPDNRRLVSTGMDRTVAIWDTRVGHFITGFPILDASGTSLDVSPDSKIIAVADQTGVIRLIDAEGLRDLWSSSSVNRTGIEDMVTRIRFSHDGTKLLSAGYRGQLDVIDSDIGATYVSCVDRLKELLIRQEYDAGAADMLAQHGRHHLLSGNTFPVAVDYLRADWLRIAGAFHESAMYLEKLAQDDDSIVPSHVASLFWRGGDLENASRLYKETEADGTISQKLGRLYSQDISRQDHTAVSTLIASKMAFFDLRPTPNRKRFCTLERQPRVFDPESGDVLHTVPFTSGKVGSGSLCIDDSGEHILQMTQNNRLQLLSKSSGELISPESLGFDFGPILLHPENRYCVSTTKSGRVRFHNLNMLNVDLELHVLEAPITRIEFSRAGDMLICGSDDGQLAAVDCKERTLAARTSGHFGSVLGIAINPRGTLVASAGDDGTIRIWSASTLNEITRINYSGRPTGVDFSSDGRLLAATGTDRHIHFYSAGSWRQIRSVEAHEAHVTCVRFGPDDNYVLSAGLDGRIVKTSTFPDGVTTISGLLRQRDGSPKSESLDSQIDQNPQGASLYLNRGFSYMQQGLLFEARHDFARYVLIEGRNASQSGSAREKFASAIGNYHLDDDNREKLASIASSNAETLEETVFKLHAAILLKKWDIAQSLCSNDAPYASSELRLPFLYAKAVSLESARDFGGAIRVLNELLEKITHGRDCSYLLNLRAICHLHLADPQSANVDIAGAVNIDPADPIGFHNKVYAAIQGGKTPRPRDVTEWNRRRMLLGLAGVQVELQTGEQIGAVVIGFSSGGNAVESGLEIGDRIERVNGIPVENRFEFTRRVSECLPEETIAVDFSRAGNSHSAKIRLFPFRRFMKADKGSQNESD